MLWSLLQTSLKQQGEALLDLQSVKAVAKEAHREVRNCPKRKKPAGFPYTGLHRARQRLQMPLHPAQQKQSAVSMFSLLMMRQL